MDKPRIVIEVKRHKQNCILIKQRYQYMTENCEVISFMQGVTTYKGMIKMKPF